jgi:hypothetical protein
MSFSNLPTKPVGFVRAVLGSLLIGLPFIPSAAFAAPVAQLPSEQAPSQQVPTQQVPSEQVPSQQIPSQEIPSQQAAPSDGIIIPETGRMVKLTELKVASVPLAPQNPCPSIYYENPYSQYVVVPQVCRPNLVTQQLGQMGLLESVRATGGATMTKESQYIRTPNTTSPNAPY